MFRFREVCLVFVFAYNLEVEKSGEMTLPKTNECALKIGLALRGKSSPFGTMSSGRDTLVLASENE